MKKNRILTESEKRQLIDDKQKAILESFTSVFNRIKRVDDKELIKEDQDTEFRNAQAVTSRIKDKANELLQSNPVKVYSGWALDKVNDPNTEEKYRATAENMLNNPEEVSEVLDIRPRLSWDIEKLKRGEFGPMVVFRYDYGDKSIEATLKNVKNGLLTLNGDKPKDYITKDGFHTLVSIMKMAIDAATDYNEEEKNRLLRLVISDLKRYIKEDIGNSINETSGDFVKVTEELWNNADPETRADMLASATDEIDSNNPLIYREYRELPPEVQGSMWTDI